MDREKQYVSIFDMVKSGVSEELDADIRRRKVSREKSIFMRDLSRRGALPCKRRVSRSSVKEGHLVNALAPRGDEGRGTLR